MAGRTTTVYTCRTLENVAPQVDVDVFVNALSTLISHHEL